LQFDLVTQVAKYCVEKVFPKTPTICHWSNKQSHDNVNVAVSGGRDAQTNRAMF